MTPTPQIDDQGLLEKARGCTARIGRIEHLGQVFWVKREEELSWRLRLQKGASASAFERERRALHQLGGRHPAVPPIVAEGADFFVLPDAGPSLETLLRRNRNPDLEADQRHRAFADGGAALAGFHAKGLTHGRPYLKDVCWNDGDITFLDFENYRPRRNTIRGHAYDVVIFFFSGLALAGAPVRELDIARQAYRDNDPGGVWEHAQNLVRKRRWVNWLTKPIQARRGGKAKEFKAIPLTVDWFAK